MRPSLVRTSRPRRRPRSGACKRRGGLGGVAEPVQHRQLRGAGLGGDQPQRAAGLDRRELPVIAEQPDDRAPRGGELHELVEQERARHPGLVDEHHVAGAQARTCAPAPAPGRPRGAGRRTGPRSTRAGTCAGSRPATPSSRPSTSAAAAEVASGTRPLPALAEHVGEGAHRGRLARPGGADPGQQQPRVAGERGHQGALPGVERGAARRPRTRPARRPPTARTSP